MVIQDILHGTGMCPECDEYSLIYLINGRNIYCNRCDTERIKHKSIIKVKIWYNKKYISSSFGGAAPFNRFYSNVIWMFKDGCNK